MSYSEYHGQNKLPIGHLILSFFSNTQEIKMSLIFHHISYTRTHFFFDKSFKVEISLPLKSQD